ncbi:hypothetical protein PAPYR_2381 [Paratrimastix pyriformis]|uniref:Uncharacterized protein n=1 Tax=Paratrimastix pyriformis TaxID=342808 RepID=A0ABQ8UUV3_9EUKA|nr:hypothetical protein PAPYR_2381 [Paratrimastix pyriformis]
MGDVVTNARVRDPDLSQKKGVLIAFDYEQITEFDYWEYVIMLAQICLLLYPEPPTIVLCLSSSEVPQFNDQKLRGTTITRLALTPLILQVNLHFGQFYAHRQKECLNWRIRQRLGNKGWAQISGVYSAPGCLQGKGDMSTVTVDSFSATVRILDDGLSAVILTKSLRRKILPFGPLLNNGSERFTRGLAVPVDPDSGGTTSVFCLPELSLASVESVATTPRPLPGCLETGVTSSVLQSFWMAKYGIALPQGGYYCSVRFGGGPPRCYPWACVWRAQPIDYPPRNSDLRCPAPLHDVCTDLFEIEEAPRVFSNTLYWADGVIPATPNLAEASTNPLPENFSSPEPYVPRFVKFDRRPQEKPQQELSHQESAASYVPQWTKGKRKEKIAPKQKNPNASKSAMGPPKSRIKRLAGAIVKPPTASEPPNPTEKSPAKPPVKPPAAAAAAKPAAAAAKPAAAAAKPATAAAKPATAAAKPATAAAKPATAAAKSATAAAKPATAAAKSAAAKPAAAAAKSAAKPVTASKPPAKPPAKPPVKPPAKLPATDAKPPFLVVPAMMKAPQPAVAMRPAPGDSPEKTLARFVGTKHSHDEDVITARFASQPCAGSNKVARHVVLDDDD